MFLFLYVSFAFLIGFSILQYYERKKWKLNCIYTPSERIIHWMTVGLTMGLIFTAVMNINYYSKEDIMESFDFSFPFSGLHDVDLSAQLFIARYERRIVWDHHFIMGVLLLSITLPKLFMYTFFNNKSKYVNLIFFSYFAIFITMAITGTILHLQNWMEINYDFRENARDVHHYAYYAMLAWIPIHVGYIIYKTITTKKDIIGRMIHSGKRSKEQKLEIKRSEENENQK